MGKKYKSAKALRAAADRYFSGISYQEPVVREVPVYEDREFIRRGERIIRQVPALDAYGHALIALEPVLQTDGTPLFRTIWTQPPSLPELLQALGVSAEEWAEMARSEALAAACAYAGGRIEIFNIQRLDSSNANGAKFQLERKFGWTEAQQDSGPVRVEIVSGEDYSG